MVTRTISKPSEDECEVLRMISIQADEVANFLGECVNQSFLRFTVDSSPYFTGELPDGGNGVRTREPSASEDSTWELAVMRI